MTDKRPLHELIVDRIAELCGRFHDQADHPLAIPELTIEPNLAFTAILIEENTRHLQSGIIPDAKKPEVAERLDEILTLAPEYDSTGTSGFYWAKVRDALGDLFDELTAAVPS